MEKPIFALDNSTDLKLISEDDAELVVKLINNNLEHLKPWLPWAMKEMTLEDEKKFIKQTLEKFNQGKEVSCVIKYKGEPAGIIGTHMIDTINKSVSIGYWLGAEFQGKGLMIRSVSKFVDYLFAQFELNKVIIRAAINNSGSRKIPEKLGYTMEGISRDHEFINGKFVSHAVYSLLKAEHKLVNSKNSVN